MLHNKLRNAPAIASILSFAVVWVVPTAVHAQVPVNGQAAKQAVKLDEIATLRSAKKLLEEANHDYKGHRAKAVSAIHKAIVEIEHHGVKTGVKQTAANPAAAAAKANARAVAAANGSKTPAVHESQVNSDVQLRAAQELLVKVQSELSTGKHPKALAHVQLALQELQVALQIK